MPRDREKARIQYKKWYARNREKKLAQRRAYAAKHPERINAASLKAYYKNRELRLKQRRAYYLKNKRQVVNNDLLKRYGITLLEYETMFTNQNGVCATCQGANNERRLAVDHCHTDGFVRGLLCTLCNRMLGCARDKINILIAGIQYLEKQRRAA